MAEKREDRDCVDAGNYAVDGPFGQRQIGGGGNLGPNILDLPYATSAEAKGVYCKITEIEPGRREGMSIEQNQSRLERKNAAVRREIDRLVERRD